MNSVLVRDNLDSCRKIPKKAGLVTTMEGGDILRGRASGARRALRGHSVTHVSLISHVEDTCSDTDHSEKTAEGNRDLQHKPL